MLKFASPSLNEATSSSDTVEHICMETLESGEIAVVIRFLLLVLSVCSKQFHQQLFYVHSFPTQTRVDRRTAKNHYLLSIGAVSARARGDCNISNSAALCMRLWTNN